MNSLIESLLQPVSADHPVGTLSPYNPELDELEALLKGKPEVEIGSMIKPAEPPDWRALESKSADYLKRSKHLRVASIYCCSALKLRGLPGFRDGLQLIAGLVENFWPVIHPVLDPEDNNDPTQRLNIIGTITQPRGSVSGWLTIVDYVYACPLIEKKGMPPITLEMVEAAANGGEGQGDPGAMLREAGTETLAAQGLVVQEAQEAVKRLDQFLTTTLGGGGTTSFEVIETLLQKVAAVILPAGGAAEASTAENGTPESAGSEPATGGGGAFVSGVIRNRTDVVKALDNICDYYQRQEPGSPVPFLLRRAQKLANMHFVAAMQELNLANPDALRPSLGSSLDSVLPPS